MHATNNRHVEKLLKAPRSLCLFVLPRCTSTAKIEIVMLRFFLLFQRLKAQSLSQLVCSYAVNDICGVFNNVVF